MTEPTREPDAPTTDGGSSSTTADDAAGAAGPAAAPTGGAPTGGAPGAGPTFEQRMEGFGREVEDAANRFGRGAEAAAERFSRDPGVKTAANTFRIAWGLIVLAFGLWFTADVTLGLDLPGIPWRDLGPVVAPAAILLLGLLILLQAASRRQA